MNPQFKFPNLVTAPGSWYEAKSTGQVSEVQFLLAIIIDQLTLIGRGGCFASDAYLARSVGMGTTEKTIRNTLSRMVAAGYLVRRRENRKRLLWAYWSRITLPDGTKRPAGRDIKRPAGRDIEERQKTKGSKSVPTGDRRDGVKGGKSVLTDERLPPPKSKPRLTQEDFENAEALHRQLKVAGVRQGCQWNKNAWAGQMALLRQEVGVNRLLRVLDWYLPRMPSSQHSARESFIPAAWCAETFRKKFSNIEAAMTRDHAKNPKDAPVKVGQEAEQIATRLARSLTWPKDSAGQLGRAVQVSLDRVKEFMKDLHRMDPRPDDMLSSFAHVVLCNLGAVDHAVESHFRDLNGRLQEWKNWGGDLVKLAWTADSPAMKTWGRKEGERFAANPKLYADLVEVVSER